MKDDDINKKIEVLVIKNRFPCEVILKFPVSGERLVPHMSFWLVPKNIHKKITKTMLLSQIMEFLRDGNRLGIFYLPLFSDDRGEYSVRFFIDPLDIAFLGLEISDIFLNDRYNNHDIESKKTIGMIWSVYGRKN